MNKEQELVFMTLEKFISMRYLANFASVHLIHVPLFTDSFLVCGTKFLPCCYFRCRTYARHLLRGVIS